VAPAQRPRVDSISLMKRAGGSPSPLRCSAARAARSASRGARCLPRPSIPSRTRPTVQAARTKITIIAMTMEVTNTPFRQSMSHGTGKELSYGPCNRNCNAGGAGGTALGPIVCQAKITMSRWKRGFFALDFITTSAPGSGGTHSRTFSTQAPASLTRKLLQSTARPTEPAQRQHPTLRGLPTLYTACMPCPA
jgi:hypothetical protein